MHNYVMAFIMSLIDSNDDDYFDHSEQFDPNLFHIWNPLHKPVTLQYTTEQLHSNIFYINLKNDLILATEMIHEGDIDLDPEYQRGQFFSLNSPDC